MRITSTKLQKKSPVNSLPGFNNLIININYHLLPRIQHQ